MLCIPTILREDNEDNRTTKHQLKPRHEPLLFSIHSLLPIPLLHHPTPHPIPPPLKALTKSTRWTSTRTTTLLTQDIISETGQKMRNRARREIGALTKTMMKVDLWRRAGVRLEIQAEAGVLLLVWESKFVKKKRFFWPLCCCLCPTFSEGQFFFELRELITRFVWLASN